MQYQVQEMLRIERIFEPQGIEEELAAYNPLIPDGVNWKATLLIEFPDADAAPRRARDAERHRGPLLGRGSAVMSAYMRSPTRISSARTTRRPRRCISCASSSRPRWCAAAKAGRAVLASAWITSSTGTQSAPLPAEVRASLVRDLA